MKKILVIAVHPDDETLGCGGTLLKHKESGDEINWLIMTEATLENGYDKKYISQKDLQIAEVDKYYGFNKTIRAGFPATGLDREPKKEIVQKISQVLNEIKPETIYLPFHSDIHSDHRIVFEAAFSCTKTFRFPFIKKVLMMETLSETEMAPSTQLHTFTPNVFVDISKFWEKKLDAMKIYTTEVQEGPFPRSMRTIEAQGRLRGSTICTDAAECFCLLKEIL